MKVRVTGLLVEADQILLLQQDTGAGRNWSLPGGKVEEGETLEAALQREMREETGLDVSIGCLLYVCDFFDPRLERPGDAVHILHITFQVTRTGGELGDMTAGTDTQPIHAVQLVPIEKLTDHGFTERFRNLVREGFPGAGSYQGPKARIGL